MGLVLWATVLLRYLQWPNYLALRDIEQSFLDKAMEKIKWSLNKLVEKQKLSQTEADKIFARITPVVDMKQALKV